MTTEQTEFEQQQHAAEQGDVHAQFILGMMYYRGAGVTQNYTEAVKWLKSAAKQGHAEAQYQLGQMYEHGEGVEKDYAKSFEWYQRAAKKGFAEAQYKLGQMYEQGKGVEEDYTESFEWYQRAAKQGHAEAQRALGLMYKHGKGVEPNYSEAYKWLTLAATNGLDYERKDLLKKMTATQIAQVQYDLGVIYENGDGVIQDYTEAYKWLTLAEENDHEHAQKARDSLAKKMASAQITQAQAAATQWQQNNP